MRNRIALTTNDKDELIAVKWKCPNKCNCKKLHQLESRPIDSRCKNFPKEHIKPYEEIEI